jgi:plasmid segregation protein ParM
MRAAVDIGFGFVKVLNEKEKKASFPCVLAKRSDSALKGIIGGVTDDYSVHYWEEGAEGSKTNERRIYVGEAAMTNGGERRWDDKGKFNIDDLKVFITTAIGLVNPDNEDVDLCVGLPMSYYVEVKDSLEQALNGFKASVAIIGMKPIRQVNIKSIFVFPQGAGAYYAAICGIDGEIKDYELAGSSVGVIDIGYRTVDYLVMGKGRKGITMIDGLYGSLEEDGMNVAFQDIQKALMDDGTVKEEIGIIEVEKALLWFGGQLEYKTGDINITQYEEKAYAERAEQISSKIKLKWGSEGNRLRKVFITGGGGEALYPFLKGKFEQAELQDNASHANCEGYLGAQARKMKRQ